MPRAPENNKIGPHEIYYDADVLTVLQSATGAQCAKHIFKAPDGSTTATPCDFGYLWLPSAIRVPDIDTLAVALQALADTPTRCVIRGAVLPDTETDFGIPRRMVPRPNEPATLRDTPRTWVALDVDGYKGSLKAYYQHLFALFPCFDGVSHVVQRSASFGLVPGELRVRLWFRCSLPASGGYWKALMSSGLAALCIDPSLFGAVHIHYTASPTFTGVDDPCAERVTLHQDLLDEIDLSAVAPEKRLIASIVVTGDATEPVVVGDAQQIENTLARITRQIAANASGHNHGYAIGGELYCIGCPVERAIPAMEAAITRAHGRTPRPNEAIDMWNTVAARAAVGQIRTTNPPVAAVFAAEPDAPPAGPAAIQAASEAQRMTDDDATGEWTSDAHANAGRYDRMFFNGFLHWNGSDFELLKSGCWKPLETETTLELRVSRDTRLSRSKVTAAAFAMRALRLREALNPPCSISTGRTLDTIIMFRNGYMKRGEVIAGERKLYAHNADHFALSALDVDYTPGATCPRFDAFLEEVFPGDLVAQTMILRIMAYVLTPDISFQKFFLLVGPPASGKTTLTKLIDAILGRDNVASISSMESLTEPFGLQPLLGKMLAYFPEANQIGGSSKIGRAVTNIIKLITGGDRVTVNRKNSAQLCIRLPARMVATCNIPPELGDDSGALARRLVVINFPVSFQDRMDLSLEDTLLSEKEGVVNRLLEAFPGLYGKNAESGFHTPDSAREVRESVLRDASPPATFLAECTERHPEGSVSVSDLTDTALRWTTQNRTHPISSLALGRLIAHMPGVRRSASNSVERRYMGIRLNVRGAALRAGSFD